MNDDGNFQRRRRARNIAIFLALSAWVVMVYIAIMVKIHHEIRDRPPSNNASYDTQ